jgi:hypothetical protein
MKFHDVSRERDLLKLKAERMEKILVDKEIVTPEELENQAVQDQGTNMMLVEEYHERFEELK